MIVFVTVLYYGITKVMSFSPREKNCSAEGYYADLTTKDGKPAIIDRKPCLIECGKGYWGAHCINATFFKDARCWCY